MYPANAFGSRVRCDWVTLGSSPTKNTFRLGGPQPPFSISSSFIFFFVLHRFFLKATSSEYRSRRWRVCLQRKQALHESNTLQISSEKRYHDYRKYLAGHFFFFFTQVQTPVTLCSGELWSILVVRLACAHSADLRSRLRHVSSAPSVAYSTGCSRVVTHPGTNPARRCLTSVI